MKIFLADPHPQVRSALSLILSQIPEASVISEIEDIFQLLVLCAQQCPDLILIDPELVRSRRRSQEGARQMGSFSVIHRICPNTKVVVISSQLEMEREALALGADGFISKTELPEVLLAKITGLWDQ